MENSVFKYTRRIEKDFDVTDYTTVYYGKLLELYQNYPTFFTSYEMKIDQKMEEISYELYGSVDYADLILSANNDVFLWGMSYNTDIVIDQSDALKIIIRNELNIPNEGVTESLLEVFDIIENNVDLSNSRRRTITVPKPEKLNTILSLVDDYRTENSIKLAEPGEITNE